MNKMRESVFISFLRTFCKSFALVFGIGLGVLAVGVFFSLSAKSVGGEDTTQMIIKPDEEGRRAPLPSSSPVILRIDIHGFIGSRLLNARLIETQLLDSREKMLKNDRVQAIILHIDSPGGTVQDSHDIYASLMAYKKEYEVPIYAYINGMCASGGMYIACSADKIFASSTGVIGSIGVIMGPKFNVSKLMERYGISQVTLTEGKGKDLLSPYRPLDEEGLSSLKDILAYNYKQFTDVVVENRPRVDRNKLINTYGAQLYDPPKAQEIGYIDESRATYFSVLKQLAEAAEIDEEPYQVIELKPSHSLLSNFLQGQSSIFSGRIKHEFELIPGLNTEWMGRSLYLYCPALQNGR